MRKNILFLCTGNSCRSQIAEGFCRHLWGQDLNVYSAGTKKHGLNDRAMKVMNEIGIDISSHYSKTMEELYQISFDYVITVCDSAKENCPYFPGGKIIHASFQDPPLLTKDMTVEEDILNVYRRVRDEIYELMKNLHRLLEQ